MLKFEKSREGIDSVVVWGFREEAFSTEAGCRVIFPEVAQLLKFLLEYGNSVGKTMCEALYRSSKQSKSIHKSIYVFSAFEQELEFPLGAVRC